VARVPIHAALNPASNALRGIHGECLPGVRLVAAYEAQTGLVLAQREGEAENRTSRVGRDR
jgi:hypothetical protein